MNLISFDLPDRIEELTVWLELQIVDLHLAELVAELAAIHQVQPPPADSVGAVLDVLDAAKLQEVLSNGLSILSSNDIDRLITQPYYLLYLQELVFREGGPHWRQVPRSDELEAAAAHSLQLLREKLAATPTPEDGPVAVPESELRWAVPLKETGRQIGVRFRKKRLTAWYRRPWPWLVNVATAAAVFVIVYFSFKVPPDFYEKPQPSRFVWTSPDDLSRPATAELYWHRLASVKQWWFSEKPAKKVQLALRMGQLSQGCSVLILQDHKPLLPADADRLKNTCRDWAKELNGYITDLQSDNADVQEIQKKTDALVNRLSDKLEYGLKG